MEDNLNDKRPPPTLMPSGGRPVEKGVMGEGLGMTILVMMLVAIIVSVIKVYLLIWK